MDNTERRLEESQRDLDEARNGLDRALRYIQLGKYQSAARVIRNDVIVCVKSAELRARLMVKP